jgi:uncharacterized protein (TIGR00369 family)
MPFEDFLALRVTRRAAGSITCRCTLRPDLLNTQGVLHGGVAASLADEAAWHCLVARYGREQACTTTDLKINYVRPLAGSHVIARAGLLRAGRTLCVTRVALHDSSQRLCAVAIVTYMLLDAAKAASSNRPS